MTGGRTIFKAFSLTGSFLKYFLVKTAYCRGLTAIQANQNTFGPIPSYSFECRTFSYKFQNRRFLSKKLNLQWIIVKYSAIYKTLILLAEILKKNCLLEYLIFKNLSGSWTRLI